MADKTGIASPLGIAGVVMIALGIILTLIGLIFLVVNQNGVKAWYMWFLVIVGILVGIVGSVCLAFALLPEQAELDKANAEAKVLAALAKTPSKTSPKRKSITFIDQQ